MQTGKQETWVDLSLLHKAFFWWNQVNLFGGKPGTEAIYNAMTNTWQIALASQLDGALFNIRSINVAAERY